MDTNKTCLIICPIGEEGSEIRRSSDELLNLVFRPAAESCGYTVVRADEIATPGLISEQVVELLLKAELVIADLTHHNPNVFYELAARHATGKPVIQVIGGEGDIPFDLKDVRTIRFDLVPSALSAATADGVKAEIVRQIQSVEMVDHVCSNPLSSFFGRDPFANSSQPTFKFFPAPIDGKYNHDFYAYFTERIRHAENDLYITGEGFECADPKGEALARGFHEAFRDALQRGVNVVRVQTKERASQQWANMLSELSGEYPDTFRLVTLAQDAASQMSSVCVIDPDDGADCVVEIMLQTEKLFGTKSADLAGTAVFIVGRQDLALDMRRRVVALCQTEQCYHYFAYGSNMDEQQMKARCPSAVRVDIAALQDHRLVFNRRGSYRPGGVASVVGAKNERVYGVVWQIASSDFDRLDEAEDRTAYRRTVATVFGLDGVNWRTYVYEAIPEGAFEPDHGYLELIVGAAVEAGLPKEYVEGLKANRQ